MNRDYFWLTEEQFGRLVALLPTDTRGKPRVDDRRVISGIVHVLRSGGRWVDAPDAYGPRKTLYNRFVRWAAKGVWADIFHALVSASGPPAEVLIDSSAVKAHRCASAGKGGEQNQAIGRSRGGRTTKIHALTDGLCRPIAFLLTGGQVADCSAADLLLEQMPKSPILHADKGYDTNAIRHKVEGKGTMPNIPPKANRRWKNCFSPFLYRDRNAIERMFGRLKDFRRIATRYDRSATSFLAAVFLAAIVSYWL
ncbi:IS5 family transposase [Mesorhizobium sp. 113-1-2]|uniref:IS5 family transposase n=1 Tax=Mesorhizobium sp. 113-1-2 TaxID=2744515 RepID=UPI001928572E|nr:IS5 family transposase [Mesorhizobium sp. 113-1-2]